MAEEFIKLGYKLSTNGTDNHLLLISLRDKKITGSKIEKICEAVHISINKNAVPGDTSALQPGGIRIGTSALTTREFKESDCIKVVELIHKAILLALKIQDKVGKKLVDFTKNLENNENIESLKKEVNDFANKFPFPF